MSYTVHQLAKLAGVSVRTLHHYDHIGLLKPARVKSNGYRVYDEPELLKLQQILFFKELDFPLPEIKKITGDPKFEIRKALSDHKRLLKEKKERIERLTATIDKTIKKISKQAHMQDEELYKAFKSHDDKYADEAKSRWGSTEAYKESQKKVAQMSKEEMIAIQKAGDELMKEIAANMIKGPAHRDVQRLISRHYNGLRTFYEPSLVMYRGLADMYVADERFTAYYEKYARGLAMFMRDAMHIYADQNE